MRHKGNAFFADAGTPHWRLLAGGPESPQEALMALDYDEKRRGIYPIGDNQPISEGVWIFATSGET